MRAARAVARFAAGVVLGHRDLLRRRIRRIVRRQPVAGRVARRALGLPVVLLAVRLPLPVDGVPLLVHELQVAGRRIARRGSAASSATRRRTRRRSSPRPCRRCCPWSGRRCPCRPSPSCRRRPSAAPRAACGSSSRAASPSTSCTRRRGSRRTSPSRRTSTRIRTSWDRCVQPTANAAIAAASARALDVRIPSSPVLTLTATRRTLPPSSARRSGASMRQFAAPRALHRPGRRQVAWRSVRICSAARSANAAIVSVGGDAVIVGNVADPTRYRFG